MSDVRINPPAGWTREKPHIPKKPNLPKKPTIVVTPPEEPVIYLETPRNGRHDSLLAPKQQLSAISTLPLQGRQRRNCQKNKRRKPSAGDMSRLVELQEALRLNIEDFVNDLHVDSNLLGVLYQYGCLTDFDKQSIECRKTPHEKNRLLIVKIQNSAPDIIETFLELLNKQPKEIYTHLHEKTHVSLKKIKQGVLGVKCVICTMIETVDIRDIIDHLYQENVVSCCLYSDISELENPFCFRQYIWGQVLGGFNDHHKIILDGISILKTALGMKYAHIATMLDRLPTNELACCCVRRRGLQKRPNSSFYRTASEYSTTSEVRGSFGEEDA